MSYSESCMTSVPAKHYFSRIHYKKPSVIYPPYIFWECSDRVLEEKTSILQSLDLNYKVKEHSPYGQYTYYCGHCGGVSSPSLELEFREPVHTSDFPFLKSATCKLCNTTTPLDELLYVDKQYYNPSMKKETLIFGEPYRKGPIVYLPFKYRSTSLADFKRKDHYCHFLITIKINDSFEQPNVKGPVKRVLNSKKPIDWGNVRNHILTPYALIVVKNRGMLTKLLKLAEEFFQESSLPSPTISLSEYDKEGPMLDTFLTYIRNPFLPMTLSNAVRNNDYYLKKKQTNTQKTTQEIILGIDSIQKFYEAFDIPKSKKIRRIILENPITLTSFITIQESIKKPDNLIRLLQLSALGEWVIDYPRYGGEKNLLDLWTKEKGETLVTNHILGHAPFLPTPEEDQEAVRNARARIFYFRDVCSLYYSICFHDDTFVPSFKGGLESLHDELAKKLHTIKTVNRKISYPNKVLRMQTKEHPYEFSLPKDTHKLGLLGILLDNCVGSYDRKVLKKQSWIFQLTKNKKPLACIEVSSGGEVVQAKIYGNKKPDPSLREKILEWATKNNLTANTRDLMA